MTSVQNFLIDKKKGGNGTVKIILVIIFQTQDYQSHFRILQWTTEAEI